MRGFALALSIFLLAGCGGGEPAPAEQNEAGRLTADIERQAERITQQAENGTVAIERALENEGAVIFENRDRLLNETSNEASPPEQR